MSGESHQIKRRSLLTLGAAATAGALIAPLRGASAVAAASSTGACGTPLYAYDNIAGQPTFYEDSGQPHIFEYDAVFYSRLQTWWNFWYGNTPGDWLAPAQIWTAGTYKNRQDGCDFSTSSMHNWGRGIDLTQIYVTTPSGLTQVFDGRQKLWPTAAAARNRARRLHWATVASLHYHFRTVLTHLYVDSKGELHDDHVHADNGWSGAGNSNLTLAYEPQPEHVNACLHHVWGYSIKVTKTWTADTTKYSAMAMSRIPGVSGQITDSQANWLAFNRATLRLGTGTQAY